MYTWVYAFLDSTNQLYNSQYAFRADHSCSQAISELVGEVAKNTEKNHTTCSIFINLSKAFDTLEHTTVIKKLERYGIRGQTLLWFKSYLEGRKLRVRCTTNVEGKQEISDTYSIKYGTPQGSCMGPLIFLIFCNDISLSLQHMHCIQFADDTTLYFSHKNANYLQYCVNSDLQILQDWFRANKLTLNASKSVCLIFNLRDYLADLKLMMNGVELPILSEKKFLGVWIDNKLTWKRHVDEVVKRIKNRINLLRRSQRFLSIHSKKVLSHAQIQSILTYGIGAWGNMINKSQQTKLQKLQNQALKLMNPSSDIREIVDQYNILRINDLIQLENYKIWYKHHNKQLPRNLQEVMRTDHENVNLLKTHRYSTRNKKEINLPRADTQTYRSSFLFKGLCKYQLLPAEIKAEKKEKKFVTDCKEYLIKLRKLEWS